MGASWVRRCSGSARSCEGEFTVYNPANSDRPIRMASQRSAGGSGAEALLTFTSNTGEPSSLGPFFGVHTLKQRRFRADDGVVADLGGSCGPAGVASATCGLSGTSSFGVRLQRSAPLVPALLALGVKPLGISCGPCTLVPDPAFYVASVAPPARRRAPSGSPGPPLTPAPARA